MMHRTFPLVLSLAACYIGSLISAKRVHYHLDITNAEIAPDGFKRSTVTANGNVPGPLISGNVGDRFLINVTDSLTDASMLRATSIHWHGMLQKHSSFMDGASEISQCPIVPGHSFLYNFTVAQQSGTYWYHSHLSTQYCDGLAGPLVIYDPKDPYKRLYDVDDESTVITLSDWYHSPAPVLFPKTTGFPPTANSTLINGLGRWIGNPTSELAVVSVKRGKRYRFRLISMSCDPMYTFYIEGHDMTVIEVDGIETKPVKVQKLDIYPGQRYSVVVTMSKHIDNYWIRAIPSAGNTTTIGGINSAILRYNGAPHKEPCAEENANHTTDLVTLHEADLHPLKNPGAPGKPYPGGADLTLTLQPAFDTTHGWSINNATFIPPNIPVLLQILSGSLSASELLPSGSVYTLPHNKVIEIIIPGGGDHPFHLHGHNFDVVRVANSSVYNYKNPVRRDVVHIGDATDEVTIRFVTDNPGPWFLHCHIDWHLAGGLAVVLAEAPKRIHVDEVVNKDWADLCPLYEKHNPDKHFDALE